MKLDRIEMRVNKHSKKNNVAFLRFCKDVCTRWKTENENAYVMLNDKYKGKEHTTSHKHRLHL